MKGDKTRFINTHFWDDNYITSLDPNEKLLFLYLLTNTLTNWIGVYEISLKRMGFDTGFDKDTLHNMLSRFAKVEKIYYYEGFIIIANFIKNQNFNANMQKGNVAKASGLPNEIKDFILSKNDEGLEALRNHFEPFRTLRKGSLNRKEKEIESESEIEEEIIHTHSNFLDLSIHINSYNYSDEEKLARINLIHKELKQSENWQTDVARLTHTGKEETWKMIKLFLDELKAKEDYFKPLSDIKKHCVSWIRKYKPAMASN